MKVKALLFSLLFCSTFCYSKPPDDKEKITSLFKKVAGFYDLNSSFQVDLSYVLFPTPTSGQVVEKYNGFLAKKKNSNYVKIDKTEFITDDKNYLKIDNESKLMQFKSKKVGDNENLFYDIKKYLSNFSSFNLTSNTNEWICTMKTPAVTFIPYSKIVIIVDKKNNSISKEVLYLIVKSKYKASNGKTKEDYARIEIIMKNFSPQIKRLELFTIANYITVKGSVNIPSGAYKSYKIVE